MEHMRSPQASSATRHAARINSGTATAPLCRQAGSEKRPGPVPAHRRSRLAGGREGVPLSCRESDPRDKKLAVRPQSGLSGAFGPSLSSSETAERRRLRCAAAVLFRPRGTAGDVQPEGSASGAVGPGGAARLAAPRRRARLCLRAKLCWPGACAPLRAAGGRAGRPQREARVAETTPLVSMPAPLSSRRRRSRRASAAPTQSPESVSASAGPQALEDKPAAKRRREAAALPRTAQNAGVGRSCAGSPRQDCAMRWEVEATSEASAGQRLPAAAKAGEAPCAPAALTAAMAARSASGRDAPVLSSRQSKASGRHTPISQEHAALRAATAPSAQTIASWRLMNLTNRGSCTGCHHCFLPPHGIWAASRQRSVERKTSPATASKLACRDDARARHPKKRRRRARCTASEAASRSKCTSSSSRCNSNGERW
mmetsp:Transcript_28326/g.67064  ORF Transcript_28326/g.67064 Transcript_28326/m.67064 type:complete len:428 (-) Transcript_28326:432-1715(-)